MKALISCAHVWPFLQDYREELDKAGVEPIIPEIRGQQLEQADLLPIIADIDGILAGDDILNQEVLSRARRLRIISKWGIGVDAIDIPFAESRGIRVTNTPGVFADELADYALGYLIMLARRQHEVDRRVREGVWYKVKGVSLRGKTIGLIGLGSSGREFARRLSVMGLRILATDPFPPDASFLRATEVQLTSIDHILSSVDILSLHAPATTETFHILDRNAIAALRAGAWVINISRGTLIDQDALTGALLSGHIAAAALDVFEDEPLPADHPLTTLPNVILGSHNGSNTQEAAQRTTAIAMRNLIEGLTS